MVAEASLVSMSCHLAGASSRLLLAEAGNLVSELLVTTCLQQLSAET
jgi:hypothetical protein